MDDGEAAEVMAAQERTFRARAGRVVQPRWRADAEWTLSGVTPYRRGVAGSAQEHEVFRRQVAQLAVDKEVLEGDVDAVHPQADEVRTNPDRAARLRFSALR